MACAIAVTLQAPLRGAANPTLVFSAPTAFAASARMTTDPQGFVYLAGKISGPPSAAVFVTRLTPSRSVVYTRVLQAGRFAGEFNDCALDITAIATDRS